MIFSSQGKDANSDDEENKTINAHRDIFILNQDKFSLENKKKE